jgi:co-chaperonin GroES (HSP10)
MIIPLGTNFLAKKLSQDEVKAESGIVLATKADLEKSAFIKVEVVDPGETKYEEGDILYISRNSERAITDKLYLVQDHNVHAVERNEDDR